jgi:KTSC domain
MSWSKNVFSSHVDMLEYDLETQQLRVTWKNGRVSAYEGVDEATAHQLWQAPSVGTFIHSEIKPNYRHKYV